MTIVTIVTETAIVFDAVAPAPKGRILHHPQYNFPNSDGNSEWRLYFGLTLLVPEA